ncbi:MAG: hypothetical protein FJ225_07255 [Lentisphaerae bacterium]|nr:hypothetical protein [Lentisphaerota bacterium]
MAPRKAPQQRNSSRTQPAFIGRCQVKLSGLSNPSVRRVLRSFAQKDRADEGNRNPLSSPALVGRIEGRIEGRLNMDEAGRLVQAAESVRDRLLIGLLYGCGLKVGELCRLRWMDMVLRHSYA